jgi:hypothetical protein
MFRFSRLYALFALVLAAGCAHRAPTPDGRMIAEYQPGKDAIVCKTPYQATYVLRHMPTPPSDPPPKEWIPEHEVVDVFIRGLGKRHSIGFEKSSDGTLCAVAGEEKLKLEPGRYCWHIHPHSQYTGLKWVLHETGERVVEVISLPFGLAALVIVVPLVVGFYLVFWPIFIFF